MKLPTLPPDPPQPQGPALGAPVAVHLRTPDLDRSLRFYAGLLGLPLVRTEGKPKRRYFLALGAGLLVLEEGVEPPGGGVVEQIAFAVPDLDALEGVRKRLLGGGVPVSGLQDLGYAEGLRFRDPVTGAFLQALTPVRAFTPEERFGDPELVAAAVELLGRD